MLYMMCVLCVGVLVGLCGLCCSSAPYFGVVCIVVSSVFCCGLIAVWGSSFLSLLLFIVYLGGMMVVFAYSVVMTDGFELFSPFRKGGVFVKVNVVLYVVLGVGCVLGLWVGSLGFSFLFNGEVGWHFMLEDGVGVSLLYSLGCVGLLVCAWSLLLALFVVVEMVRGGFHGGGLRSV